MAKRPTRKSQQMVEVSDLESEPAQSSGLNLEAGLIFATFLGLIVGCVMAQMCLSKYFGAGLLS